MLGDLGLALAVLDALLFWVLGYGLIPMLISRVPCAGVCICFLHEGSVGAWTRLGRGKGIYWAGGGHDLGGMDGRRHLVLFYPTLCVFCVSVSCNPVCTRLAWFFFPLLLLARGRLFSRLRGSG